PPRRLDPGAGGRTSLRGLPGRPRREQQGRARRAGRRGPGPGLALQPARDRVVAPRGGRASAGGVPRGIARAAASVRRVGPLVPYVQQMHQAWFAFRTYGRPCHPGLRVCFAILAGLAPLHGERAAARGAGRGVVDADAFVETSSYGPRAIDATVRVLGIDVI